jgi:hypothetical protein
MDDRTSGGSINGSAMKSKFITVGSYRTAIEAYSAKQYLESKGVPAFVMDEHNSTLGWWNDTEVKLRVSAQNEQQAVLLLAAVKN